MAHSSNHLQHNTSRHITVLAISEIDHSATDGTCVAFEMVSFFSSFPPFLFVCLVLVYFVVVVVVLEGVCFLLFMFVFCFVFVF